MRRAESTLGAASLSYPTLTLCEPVDDSTLNTIVTTHNLSGIYPQAQVKLRANRVRLKARATCQGSARLDYNVSRVD